MRIGYGYDLHRLVKDRKFILGGIEIPANKGLLGHSDADVLLHSVCDALLGAAGMGDIGEHFPDTDERFRGISSSVLLEKTGNLIRGKGFFVENMDCIVFAQEVKITPYKNEIKKKIAEILKIEAGKINVKAKTGEEVDAVGRNEAVAACCTVLLSKEKV